MSAQPMFPMRSIACAIALMPLLAAPTLAAEAARVLGPQPALERYDATVPESAVPEGAIDIPAMITAPGADDGVRLIDDLAGLTIEFVGNRGGRESGDFVSFVGATRAEADRGALYAALRETLAVYQGLPLTLGDVRFIQQDITDAYRRVGYPLLAVVVPPQEVIDGVLRVQVNEFRLAGVDVVWKDDEGAYSKDAERWTPERDIERRVAPVLEADILAQRDLDELVQGLNRNPFRGARVVFQPGSDIGETRALIQIDEQRTWNANLGYNNHGTDAAGNHRFSVGGTFGNLPVLDHSLSWNAVIGSSLDEFQSYSLIYTVPNRFGHTLTVNGNWSDTSSSTLPGIDSASTSWQVTTNYAFPLRSGSDWELLGSAAFAFKHLERESLFGGQAVGGAEFDAAVATLSATLNVRQERASNQFVLALHRSFEGFTGRNSTANFRQFHNSFDGSPAYQYAVFNYARVQELEAIVPQLAGWRAETQLSVQLGLDKLAGADNIALGGPATLRAYEASEVAGDRGGFLIQSISAPPIPAERLGRLGGLIRQVNMTAFAEFGTAEFETGGRSSIFDAGLAIAIALPNGASCRASLAIAGDDAGRTEAGDARAFIGCGIGF